MVLDTSQFCPPVDWHSSSTCSIEDTPSAVQPLSLDPARYCLVVSPELSFMCPLEATLLPPPGHPTPPPLHHINNTSPVILLLLSMLLAVILVAFTCSIFRFNPTLARIIHIFRFVVPRATVVQPITAPDQAQPAHEERAPMPAIFDVVSPSGELPLSNTLLDSH